MLRAASFLDHATEVVGSSSVWWVGSRDHSQSDGRDMIQKVQAWFESNRVSAKEDGVQVSLAGGDAFMCFIVGMLIGVPDPEHQTLPVTFIGITG